METKSDIARNDAPLSDDERKAWEHLVEEGRVIREPILARQKRRREALEESLRKSAEANGRKYKPMLGSSKSNSVKVIPDAVKRWVILRFAGMTLKKAGEMSGSSWAEVQEMRAGSEEFRCALAAQDASSHRLMLAKAKSILEQSQDEDAKISMPQAQLAMKIVGSLDREHFGEDSGKFRREDDEDGQQRRIGGGGFVINVIGDAASVAAKPVEAKGKAIVYADV